MEINALLLTIVAIATGIEPISSQGWTYQSIGQGWQSDYAVMDEEEPVDYRYISYNRALTTGRLFTDENLIGGVQLVVDDDYIAGRNQLLVGGRDTLYRLDLDNLSMLEYTHWPSNQSTVRDCNNRNAFQTPETCHNFVKVLLLSNNEVFACGTNAFSPTCTRRKITDMRTVLENSIEGRSRCPFSPKYNSTALLSDAGLFTATVIDSSGRDSAIIRIGGGKDFVRTMQHNSKWLNDPNFVSTYEIGNYVYVFFRETAVEFINCGKKVYSRVARVCKTDKGGSFALKNTWTTYHKARLNCSLPGNFPFYFDELQSTFYSRDDNLVYAVFSTPQNSIAGSAVCVYNMSSFHEAFDGPFKHQESPSATWIQHENLYQPKCTDGSTKRSSETSVDQMMAAKKYQLMDRAVQSRELGPVIMREGERWTHIVVDHVYTKNDMVYDVMFLATDDGKLRKMLRIPEANKTCLVEEIKIVSNGHPRPVNNMKISLEKNAVYLTTEGNILKIPVHRCYRFTTSSRCINSQDPYCGWNTRTGSCTAAPNGNPDSPFWEQDFRKCPVLDEPIQGGWSDWTTWTLCQHVGTDHMIHSCQCRSRSCTKPVPVNNGRDCTGSRIQVTNCTVNGQWTEWSEWSACSQTCGYATRTRQRQCGNPPPQHGGRECEGDYKEEVYCSTNPPCPEIPVDGRWSIWSGWSTCTRNCNSGIQTRKRNCNRPEPRRGGQHCPGNREEWRMCNTHKCREISKISPWTEWIQTNRTNGGYFQQRFRFTCRANVETSKDIKTTYAKSQAKFCFNDQKGCYKPKQLANTITSIDAFSSVDRVLKKFCRHRRKLFKKYCNCRTLGVFLVCQKCGYG